VLLYKKHNGSEYHLLKMREVNVYLKTIEI